MVARASGAAQRRKLRRLRAALRHEQQSIAMALASALHHSADKTTRAQHNAPREQRNAGTEYYKLSDEDEVLARGSRPPCLGEPRGPQDQDQQRTVEQTADYAPWYRFWMVDVTLPACCISKVVVMKSEEIIYQKVYVSPRLPPEISFKVNWMKEMDSEVAGSSKDTQRIQPKPKTQLSSTGETRMWTRVHKGHREMYRV